MSVPPNATEQRWKWLPAMGTWKFHALLGAIAIFVLGPLGGVTATFMNFSIGFFVGGQVLAGILGSAVTYGYGAEGKHGANYMQTLAASVASMAGMAVLIQAMHWLGMDVPEAWKLMLYYLCIGMFGVGVGMLYTPLLVDKMQLTYPSGFAVANILRALTDKVLLKASIAKLGIGTGIGIIGGLAGHYVPFIGATAFSGATFGAGMIVGVRIAFPALIVGVIGELLVPQLRASGWLEAEEPFRKIGFLIALGAILGAAIIDIVLVFVDFAKKLKNPGGAAEAPVEDWKKVNTQRLLAWLVFWGAGVFLVATQIFDQDPVYVIMALALVFVFMLVNGISLGISDSNPISSAFVVTVLIMSTAGLQSATGSLVCASILLIAVSIGGDMQQDRSTGWRLGTNRILQFRYQVIGVTMGAVLSVVFASVFTTAFPSLLTDQTNTKLSSDYVDAQAGLNKRIPEKLTPTDPQTSEAWMTASMAGTLDEKQKERWAAAKAVEQKAFDKWQSAMTYKFAGAIDVFIGRDDEIAPGLELSAKEQAALAGAKIDIPVPMTPAVKAEAGRLVKEKREKKKGIQIEALFIGISIGLVIEALRKTLRKSKRYQAWKKQSKGNNAVDFVLDTTVLASPYASSFGGFVNWQTSMWFAIGGTLASVTELFKKKKVPKPGEPEIPEDMSTNSLVGGGLIAGESLFYLFYGMISLIITLAAG